MSDITITQLVSYYDGKTSLRGLLGVSVESMEPVAALASRWYSQGRYKQAATVFQGLVALDENAYYGHAGLGAIALVQEQYEEASVHLRRAFAIVPDDLTIAVNLGEALVMSGELAEGLQILNTAMDQDPDHKDPFVNRARSLIHGLRNQIEQTQAGR